MNRTKKMIMWVLFAPLISILEAVADPPPPPTLTFFYNYPAPSNYVSSTTVIYGGGFYNCLNSVHGAGFTQNNPPPTIYELPSGVPSGVVWTTGNGSISFILAQNFMPCVTNAAIGNSSALGQAVVQNLNINSLQLSYGGNGSSGAFSFSYNVTLPPVTNSFTLLGYTYDLVQCVLDTAQSSIKCQFNAETNMK